jgi:hypothetical protein
MNQLRKLEYYRMGAWSPYFSVNWWPVGCLSSWVWSRWPGARERMPSSRKAGSRFGPPDGMFVNYFILLHLECLSIIISTHDKCLLFRQHIYTWQPLFGNNSLDIIYDVNLDPIMCYKWVWYWTRPNIVKNECFEDISIILHTTSAWDDLKINYSY